MSVKLPGSRGRRRRPRAFRCLHVDSFVGVRGGADNAALSANRLLVPPQATLLLDGLLRLAVLTPQGYGPAAPVGPPDDFSGPPPDAVEGMEWGKSAKGRPKQTKGWRRAAHP